MCGRGRFPRSARQAAADRKGHLCVKLSKTQLPNWNQRYCSTFGALTSVGWVLQLSGSQMLARRGFRRGSSEGRRVEEASVAASPVRQRWRCLVSGLHPAAGKLPVSPHTGKACALRQPGTQRPSHVPRLQAPLRLSSPPCSVPALDCWLPSHQTVKEGIVNPKSLRFHFGLGREMKFRM